MAPSNWIGQRRLDVEMIDGTKHLVSTVFADGVAYEMTAAKHNWPPAQTANMQALAFVSWHSLRRAGEIDKGTSFEQFRDEMLQIRLVADDDDTVGPTRPGQLPG